MMIIAEMMIIAKMILRTGLDFLELFNTSTSKTHNHIPGVCVPFCQECQQ